VKGRVALVTGGSQGIGRAISEELARRGATVLVNHYPSESDAAKAAATVEAIKAAGGTALALQADVTKQDQVEKMIKDALEAQGKIDILVNNAGITRDKLIMMMDEPDWDAVLSTNLKSMFLCSKAAIKGMMRQRYGRIVNMSSVVGISGNAGQTNYSASKAGVIGFTKSLAREVASRSITVNAIAPGFIPSALTEVLPDEIKQSVMNTIPLKRMGTPEEIAYGVAFLASDEAAYITGHVLSIDGGMVMG
jgi:3-oxoacyl-[acyl-carrier protein] reductase